MAAGKLGWLTLVGAHLYFWGRLAYVPLYAFAVTGVRSLAWAAASLGLLLVIGALLFG